MTGLDICLDKSCILLIRILGFEIVLMATVCSELSICSILGKDVSGREGGGKFSFHLPQREVNVMALDL